MTGVPDMSDNDRRTTPGNKCYLAGPMRGLPQFNYDTFNRVAELLRTQYGADVINPAAHDLDTWPDLPTTCPEAWATGTIIPAMEPWVQQQFRWDVMQLLNADYIVLLPGWERSVGAQVEAVIAKLIGLPCLQITRTDTIVPADDDIQDIMDGLK